MAEAGAHGLVDEQHSVVLVPGARVFVQRQVGVDEEGAVDVQHPEQAGAAGPPLQSALNGSGGVQTGGAGYH